MVEAVLRVAASGARSACRRCSLPRAAPFARTPTQTAKRAKPSPPRTFATKPNTIADQAPFDNGRPLPRPPYTESRGKGPQGRPPSSDRTGLGPPRTNTRRSSSFTIHRKKPKNFSANNLESRLSCFGPVVFVNRRSGFGGVLVLRRPRWRLQTSAPCHRPRRCARGRDSLYGKPVASGRISLCSARPRPHSRTKRGSRRECSKRGGRK